MIKVPISKYHSLASDYVILDLRSISPAIPLGDMPKFAVELCKRNGIVGADGVACLISFDGYSAEVRTFNPNGSESELCINGLRCAARKLFSETTTKQIVIRRGSAQILVSSRDVVSPNLPAIAVTVPPPTLTLPAPFFAGTYTIPPHEPFFINDHDFERATLFNPHLIAIHSRLSVSDLTRLGEELQRDSRFPLGINISCMTLLEGDKFFMSTFERGGAGLTQSSSSALICGAAILWETERIADEATITGYSEGGASMILREDNTFITAIANATHVYDANLDVEPSSYLIKPLFAGSANMDEIDAYARWLSSLRIKELKAFVES